MEILIRHRYAGSSQFNLSHEVKLYLNGLRCEVVKELESSFILNNQ